MSELPVAPRHHHQLGIIMTAAITTLALGDPAIPHVVFLFAMFLTFFFLKLESRRFRVFELSHKRVRILERYFYGEVLQDTELPEWRARLAEELRVPRSPVSHMDALGWRLRRNYLWLYAALFLLWLIKLDFAGGAGRAAARAGAGRRHRGAARLAGDGGSRRLLRGAAGGRRVRCSS